MGVIIDADAKTPLTILQKRLAQAKCAFHKLRNNSRMFNLSNCRVRLQLVSTLVTSVLLFGAPLFACYSNVDMHVTASHCVFRDVEAFGREITRWALRATGDTRNSLLYVMGNCESV